jgi:hypothetical protein
LDGKATVGIGPDSDVVTVHAHLTGDAHSLFFVAEK